MASSYTPDARIRVTRRALIVWLSALLVYIVAILGRTSFGVAGVEAIERFHVDASRIAVFTAVQVGVYALAQIPTGMLIDRFGPRALLVVGAVVMACGQVVLGLSDSYAIAIVARVFIGAGDATAFLSAMRILPFWFPLRRTPLFTQLTGGLGQIGQFLSAVPFLHLLELRGWTIAFCSIGALGLLVALTAAIAVADSPDEPAQSTADRKTKPRKPRTPIRKVLAQVGTSAVCWQGFFIHYINMVPQVVFTMLWGVPLMTLGMGLSPAQAGLVLSLNTVAVVCAGPLHGIISARLGAKRDLFALFCTISIAVAWIIFMLPETPRGIGAIIIVNLIVGSLTSASNYGFDYVRERMDRGVVATGTGLANMGGFVSGMVAAQAVGIVLDHHATGINYTWMDFRYAWWAWLSVWFLGVVGLLISRRWSARQWEAQQAEKNKPGREGRAYPVRYVEESKER